MFLSTVMTSLAQAGSKGGTLDAVRRSLSLNPAAIFTLGLSAVGIVAVIVGGRGKGGGPDDQE